MKEPMVILEYGSAKNITFRGKYDTQIPVSEWNRMSDTARDAVREEAMYDLVDIWVATEGAKE